MGGEESQTQTQQGTSTWNPVQSENYENLLRRADEWLAQGGINMGPDYSQEMLNVINQSAGTYSDMMNSTVNQEVLNNAMQASADQLQTNFERNIMPEISSTAQMTGAGAGSRRGIAEGIAVSDMNQQIMQANAQLAYQAEQDNMRNRLAGAQGMNNLMSDYMNVSNYQQSRANSYLESMMAYQSLISGNYGGTESTSGSTSATSKGGLF